MDTRELWFVCISNPDGYEYTFRRGNRLWRKNMADNDGDGVLGEPEDGVDPNRNFATNWGRDNEGSSDDPTDGDVPRNRARLRARDAGDEEGSGTGSTSGSRRTTTRRPSCSCTRRDSSSTRRRRTTDLRGTRRRRRRFRDRGQGVERGGRRPGDTRRGRVGQPLRPRPRAELYITNGDTLDDAYHTHGILGFTPEGSVPADENASRFEFEDDEGDVEAEFQRHLPFSLDLARVGGRPGQTGLAPGQRWCRTSRWTTSPSPTAIPRPSR